MKRAFFMPTLLTNHKISSSPKRGISFCNEVAIQKTHCSPPTEKTFTSSFKNTLLSLVLFLGLFSTTQHWTTTYDGLGRRIKTSSAGNTINYYYDPEVEFLELGHNVNGSRQWNLYGPDRSGIYGGAQGIGGLESCFDENTHASFGIVNNYFGDVVGLISGGSFTPYQSDLGSYGPMPGSSVNQAFQPQWRSHYLDQTGFICMGARYYDPQNGRFISPDPLGHGASMSLYDYCNGDPVNGLDPDGRCVEKGKEEFSEGYDKSYYANGADVKYDNSIQQVGGFVGNSILKAQPVIGTDPGTIAVGGQFNAALGLQFNISAQFSLSNWADPATRRIGGIISITPLTGVGTDIGASGGVLMTRSRATSPEQLNGLSGNAGGSVSAGSFVVGYDAGNWGKTPTDNIFIGRGIMTTFGLPFEVHTSATWTKSRSWNF